MASRITDPTKDDIARRIIAGQFMLDICRACKISTHSVRKVAQDRGLVIQASPNGMVNLKRGVNVKPASKPMTYPVLSAREEWAAKIANARWGAGHGA